MAFCPHRPHSLPVARMRMQAAQAGCVGLFVCCVICLGFCLGLCCCCCCFLPLLACIFGSLCCFAFSRDLHQIHLRRGQGRNPRRIFLIAQWVRSQLAILPVLTHSLFSLPTGSTSICLQPRSGSVSGRGGGAGRDPPRLNVLCVVVWQVCLSSRCATLFFEGRRHECAPLPLTPCHAQPALHFTPSLATLLCLANMQTAQRGGAAKRRRRE